MEAGTFPSTDLWSRELQARKEDSKTEALGLA